MAPFEFEKNIQDKLRDREIRPSDDAWDKIASRLGKEKAGRRSRRPWIYLAAAAIALLFGLRWAFTPQQPELEELPLVVNPQEPVDTVETQAPQLKIVKEPKEVQTKSTPVRMAALPEARPESLETTNERKALQSEGEGAVAFSDVPDTTGLEQRIATQIDKVVERFAVLESDGVSASDSEIDSLLREAQMAIIAGTKPVATDSVDAMALLDEAELELDRTFRETLFDKLKTGVNQVRVAMANRDN